MSALLYRRSRFETSQTMSRNQVPSASSSAILECIKQTLPVDDKIKGRHGNRFFFFLSPTLRCSHHGGGRGGHEANAEEKGMGEMKRETERRGESQVEAERE